MPTVDSLQTWTNGAGGTATTANQVAIVGAIARSVVVGASTLAGGSGLDGTIPEAFFIKRVLTAQEDADYIAYLNDYYDLNLTGFTQ